MKDSSKTKQGMIAEESVLKQRSPDFEQLESSYKLTGMELQNNEELFRSYLEYVPEGVYINDLEGNFLYGNRKSEEIIGYQLDELIGKNFLELNILTEDSLSKAAQLLQANIEGKSTGPDEIELINKEGHIVPVEINTNVVQRMGQKIVLGFVRDITERKQAEKALRESEENFHRSLDDSPLGVRIVTIEGETIYANRAILDIYGYDSVEELRKTPTKNRYTPQSYAEFKIRMEKRKRGNEGPSEYEISIVRKNGEIHHLQVFRKEVLWDGERQFQTIYQDITERKRDEEALRESQQQLSNIIEFLPDATMVIDKDEKVIAWNRSIEEMTGIKKEDMLGKGNKEYSIPFYGDRRPILIDLALHPDKEMEKQYTAIQRVADILFGEAYTPNLPHGKIHLSATASVLRDSKGEIIAAIECVRDNTERKRLEERLQRSEKMEALGQLAGGVAHDLNNVLGVLVAYSELLVEKLPEDSPLKRYAASILQSSLKGAAIIQDLLTLVRRGVAISEVVDLNKIVFDYLQTPEFEMLKSYHPGVKICTELEERLLNIKGSPVHLSKTIMNLVSNATEVISNQGGVTIRTENRYVDQSIRGYDDVQEGDYVVLTVSDSGMGIPDQDLRKIFEPFYTKKVMGRSGTGLGLTVVWGTVKDHRGYINVQSLEGEGTTFSLYFPVTREELTKATEAVSPSIYMGKGESILVVDDIKEQRELAVIMIGRIGYRVEALSCGEEAIEYLKNKKADLVVVDMIMEPGIDGLETYSKILEINPKQKAVIVSGFAETAQVKKALELGAGSFIRKPYIRETIGLAIRRELDRL